MRYAETGVNLEIDLTHGSIEKEATDPKLTENYLGGQGTAVKLLWDRVGPEVEPFSEDNLDRRPEAHRKLRRKKLTHSPPWSATLWPLPYTPPMQK